MEKKPKRKANKWLSFRAWSIYILLTTVSVLGIFGKLTPIYEFGSSFCSSWLASKIDARIEHYFKSRAMGEWVDSRVMRVFAPQWKLQAARSHFETGREENGFDALDEAISLCQKDLSRQQVILVDTLHTYLYYISIAKVPLAQDIRFNRILPIVIATKGLPDANDKLCIAWHEFYCHRLDSARKGFQFVIDIGRQSNDNTLTAHAYFGMHLCALASGDIIDATTNYDAASSYYPQHYEEFTDDGPNPTYDEQDYMNRNAEICYAAFKSTATLWVAEMNKRGSNKSPMQPKGSLQKVFIETQETKDVIPSRSSDIH